MVEPRIATMCGLNLKMYFLKYKKGMAQYYREGGMAAVHQAMMEPMALSGNNGIATYLCISDLDSGLAEYRVWGKAYVVWEDGTRLLSKGQVWGIQEMINCAMDVYNADLESRRRGKRLLETWSKQCRAGTFVPTSGLGGVDIYSERETGEAE